MTSDINIGQFNPNFNHFSVAGTQGVSIVNRGGDTLAIKVANKTHTISAAKYLKDNPDVAAAGVSVLDHIANHGLAEGRLPQIFDKAYYESTNTDVTAAVQQGAFKNSFEHFVRHGAKEGRLGVNPKPDTPSITFKDDGEMKVLTLYKSSGVFDLHSSSGSAARPSRLHSKEQFRSSLWSPVAENNTLLVSNKELFQVNNPKTLEPGPKNNLDASLFLKNPQVAAYFMNQNQNLNPSG